MKTNSTFLWALLFIVGTVYTTFAQDVYINIPTSSLFNRSEIIAVHNVMNTQGNKSWRVSGVNPQVRSNSGDFFKHVQLPNTSLPTSVLQWQLASIGGEVPPFKNSDVLPGYKWFISSYQTWYQPNGTARGNSGAVAFRFKVPSAAMESNAFLAGNYKIQVEQDYGRSGWYAIEFSPETFNTYLTVSEDIKWMSGANAHYLPITSLSQFRTSGTIAQTLGTVELAHTVDFNLFAKSDKKEVQFKSLNGNDRKFDVAVVHLGGNTPKLLTAPIDKNYKNYSTNGGFKVGPGNRTNFELQLSIAAADFKTYFFEAGTYTFQLKLEAKSSNGYTKAEKDIDVTVMVPFLSEIAVPGGTTAVNFTFNTVQSYNEGQSRTVPNQILISNNQNYELYVKSASNYFTSNGIQSDVPTEVLEIGIEGHPQMIALSTTSQKIISNAIPSLDKILNIKYKISALSAQSLILKQKKSYTTNVVYSFTAL